MWGLWVSKQPKADAASEAMHGKIDDTIKIYQTIHIRAEPHLMV